jgi:hypothetical protein
MHDDMNADGGWAPAVTSKPFVMPAR